MNQHPNAFIPQDLGDGLQLRQATAEDTEKLADFNARIHSGDEPNEHVGNWTRDLMSGTHPIVRAEDFTIVEDTKEDKIVSSLNLISQKWRYGDVEFGVGRPEIVGTDPDYRRRGLVRKQFDVVHAWSAERGEMLQGITGIPNFYRQFGYEMALELSGGREGYAHKVAKLGEDQEEPYTLRPATQEDLGFIANVYEAAQSRYLVTCSRTKELWEYELSGRHAKSANRIELHVIQNTDQQPVGFIAHPPDVWGGCLGASFYELVPGLSWAAVTPSVVRYLLAAGKQYAERDEKEPSDRFAFWLGSVHPAYEIISSWLPRVHKPYAWYIRIPDLPSFFKRIAPVLDERLANSTVVGYDEDLKLNFYREGVRLVFEKGRLTTAERWSPDSKEWGHAGFPGLTFTQVLMGFRSLDEINYAFPDCWVHNDQKRELLNVLFPKQPSFVQWPVS